MEESCGFKRITYEQIKNLDTNSLAYLTLKNGKIIVIKKKDISQIVGNMGKEREKINQEKITKNIKDYKNEFQEPSKESNNFEYEANKKNNVLLNQVELRLEVSKMEDKNISKDFNSTKNYCQNYNEESKSSIQEIKQVKHDIQNQKEFPRQKQEILEINYDFSNKKEYPNQKSEILEINQENNEFQKPREYPKQRPEVLEIKQNNNSIQKPKENPKPKPIKKNSKDVVVNLDNYVLCVSRSCFEPSEVGVFNNNNSTGNTQVEKLNCQNRACYTFTSKYVKPKNKFFYSVKNENQYINSFEDKEKIKYSPLKYSQKTEPNIKKAYEISENYSKYISPIHEGKSNYLTNTSDSNYISRPGNKTIIISSRSKSNNGNQLKNYARGESQANHSFTVIKETSCLKFTKQKN